MPATTAVVVAEQPAVVAQQADRLQEVHDQPSSSRIVCQDSVLTR